MDKRISVIMPARNRERTIARAIDSVIRQTHPEWELVVVDDGSTDGTAAVVEEYVRRDPRVRFMRNPSSVGAQSARNTAIRASTGQWITFLDSDDWFTDDSLETRLARAFHSGTEVVHTECLVLRADGSEPQIMGVQPVEGEVYATLLGGPATNGYYFFSRAAYDAIGGLDESIVAYQDWELGLRLSRAFKFAFQPEPSFVWDQRDQNTMSRDFCRSARGYEQVVRKHLLQILRVKGLRGASEHYRQMAGYYRQAGLTGAERRTALTARMLWPTGILRVLCRART